MACESCGTEGRLNVRKPHFYEVYSPTSNSDRLKIPDGFICRMEGRTYDSVSLIGPSGNTWPVRLIKQDNDLFFHHGWPMFVVDHRLECGDLLIFRYEGHLHFSVQVFDKSRCEKEAAFHSESSHNSCEFDNIKGHKRDREENSSLDVVVGGVLKKMKGGAIEYQELKLGADGKELIQYEVVKPISMFKEKEETFKECSANDVPIPFHMENSNEDEEAAILYRSGKQDGQYILNGVSLSNSRGSYTLCGGWMAFVRGNNIKVGDICIFELVHECELRVQIAGVGTDGLDNQVRKLAFSRPNAGRAITCHKNSTYMPMNTKVSSKCIRKVNLSDKKWSKNGQEAGLSTDVQKSGRAPNSKKMGLSSQSKVAHKKLCVQKRHRVEEELSSQAKAGLRMLFALDEQRVSLAFTSPFPNFVKIMKMFNVSGSYTLKIPHQLSAAHLPTYKREVTLRNSRGECWTVNSVPDAKGRTVHPFCGGWMAFVHDNDINFGDACIFELVAQCEMQVYISGVGKEGFDNQNGQVKLNRLTSVNTLV